MADVLIVDSGLNVIGTNDGQFVELSFTTATPSLIGVTYSLFLDSGLNVIGYNIIGDQLYIPGYVGGGPSPSNAGVQILDSGLNVIGQNVDGVIYIPTLD